MHKTVSHISEGYFHTALCGKIPEELTRVDKKGRRHAWLPLEKAADYYNAEWHKTNGYALCVKCWNHPHLILATLDNAL